MKPGLRDKKYSIRISGRELDELKRFTCDMAEAFDIDRRIENYQGRRPIGFYRWDLDCLEDVTAMALDDKAAYPDRSGPGYEAMKNLHERIKALHGQRSVAGTPGLCRPTPATPDCSGAEVGTSLRKLPPWMHGY